MILPIRSSVEDSKVISKGHFKPQRLSEKFDKSLSAHVP